VQLQERPVLDHVGVGSSVRVWHNLSPAELYEHAIRRGEANVVSSGALTAETGQHTGRSPKDKFFVREPFSEDKIWWRAGTRPLGQNLFDRLLQMNVDFCEPIEVFARDVYAFADLRIR